MSLVNGPYELSEETFSRAVGAELRSVREVRGWSRLQFRSLAQWARNMINDQPGGVVQVEPVVVRNLASFIGCTHRELADHFARFTPDVDTEESDERPK